MIYINKYVRYDTHGLSVRYEQHSAITRRVRVLSLLVVDYRTDLFVLSHFVGIHKEILDRYQYLLMSNNTQDYFYRYRYTYLGFA